MHRAPSPSRWRWLTVPAVLAGAILLGPGFGPAFAHPGNTASDGCHYCRTNCASWGVPQDQRHCHNGGGGGGTTTGGSTTDGSAPPPPPADTTPPPDPTVSGVTVDGSTVTVSVSAESGSTIRVLVGGSVAASARATGAPQTVSFQGADGSHRLEVLARDAAGNESGSVSRAVTIDSVAPEAPTVTVTSPSTPSQPWAEVTIAGERGAAWELQTTGSTAGDGPAPASETGRLSSSGPSQVRLLLSDGTYTLVVTLQDGAGNVSPEVLEELVVDLPAPPAPRLRVVSEPGASSIEVTVSGTPHGTVELRTRGGDGVSTEVSLDEDGEGTATLELHDGDHTVTATAFDFQGQSSRATAALETVVDTAGPEVTATIDEVVLAGGWLAWSVVAEPGSTVTVRSASAGIDETFESGERPRSGEVAPDAGDHTLTITAVDAYGNLSEASVLATVVAPSSSGTTLAGVGLLVALGYGGHRFARRRRDHQPGDAPAAMVDTASANDAEVLDRAAELDAE